MAKGRSKAATAAGRQPVDWQARHDVDGYPALAMVGRQVADTKGRVGAPLRQRRTPIDVMRAKGTITEAQHAAGRQFELLFALARFEALRACDLISPMGGAWRDPSPGMLDARDQVWAVLAKLGGLDWIITEAAWQVIGQGRSIKEFCAAVRLAKDAPLNPQRATGLLEGALTVMAGHFGLADRTARGRVSRQAAEWRLPETVDDG